MGSKLDEFPLSFRGKIHSQSYQKIATIVASDVPGGNRILIIKIKAQHSALSKAIKNTEFK